MFEVRKLKQKYTKGFRTALCDEKPIRVPLSARTKGEDGLTNRARRFCEMYASNPDAGEVLRLVYWELGGNEPWFERRDAMAARYLKVKVVRKYYEKCKTEYESLRQQIAKFLPGKKEPNLLDHYGVEVDRDFYTPEQLRSLIDEYIDERTKREMPLGICDCAQWLGVTHKFLKELYKRGPEWQAVLDWLQTNVGSWLMRKMVMDPKGAKGLDTLLNREGFPEKEWEVKKTESETVVTDELGKLLQEIHHGGDAGRRRLIPSTVMGVVEGESIRPALETSEPVLDR